ncbi:MAG: ABC transporter permease [Candidatus Woesearchaeota archaeon]
MSTVRAELYKNLILVRRNHFRLFDITVWPIILFFAITLFLKYISPTAQILAMAIMGLMGWRAVYHFQIESNISYMDDYWAKNTAQQLVTPLRMRDIVIAGAVSGLIKFLIVLSIYLIFAYSLFSFHIVDMFKFVIGIGYLCFTGLILGMITFGFVIRYTEKAITFAFMLPDLFVLLSGVYYPISVFPKIIVMFVHILPTFYGFELLKSMIGLGSANYFGMIIVSLAWLCFALWFLSYSIKKARESGKLCT